MERGTDEYIYFDTTEESRDGNIPVSGKRDLPQGNSLKECDWVERKAGAFLNTAAGCFNESVKIRSFSDEKTDLRPIKHSEFSVNSHDDERSVWIEGVLTISNNVIVVDSGNYKMKLFDENGTLLSSTSFPHIVFDIAHIGGDIFATCGHGFKLQKWKMIEETIVSENSSYKVEYEAQAMSYNGTYFCTLHRRESTISVLRNDGKQFKKFSMKNLLGKKLEFGSSIVIESDSHNIFVPAWGDFRGIICLSLLGSPLWYSPLRGSPEGITMVGGSLCIADEKNQCLHVMSKTGRSTDVLIQKDEISGIPHRVYYDRSQNKLFITYQNYDQNSRHIVSVLSL